MAEWSPVAGLSAVAKINFLALPGIGTPVSHPLIIILTELHSYFVKIKYVRPSTHHEGVWWIGDAAPLILNLGSSWW